MAFLRISNHDSMLSRWYSGFKPINVLRIIPKKQAAEFFGFYNMLGKLAAIIGPPMMGYIGLITGNPRLGILSIIILFISGGFLLTKVDLHEGERVSESY